MNRELVSAIDIEDCLVRLKIYPAKYTVTEIVARCPNPSHDDKNPTWSINRNKSDLEKFSKHHCFSCHFGGDIISLWANLNKIKRSDALNDLIKIYVDKTTIERIRYESTIEDREDKSADNKTIKFIEMPYEFELLTQGSPHWNYLIGRGINKEVIKEFKIGVCVDTGRPYKNKNEEKYRGMLIVPIFFGGDTVGFMARNITKKIFLYNDNCPISQVFFNWDNVEVNTKTMKAGEVWLVEGIFDALRVLSSGYLARYRRHSNVLAVLGNSLGGKTEQPRTRLLRTAHRVVVMGDGDDGGDALRASAERHLAGHVELYEVVLPRGTDPGDVPRNALKNKIMRPKFLNRFKKIEKIIVDYEINT